MTLTKNLGGWLQGLAIAAGAAVLGHLAKPDVIPQILPPEYAASAVVVVQVLQALLGQRAFEKNWDGSSANVAAPPKPPSW